MPKPFLFLLLAFALCFGQTAKNADIDSFKDRVSTLEMERDTIKKSIDSLNSKFLSDNYISIKAAKETQELHNKAFDKMQCSYQIFIAMAAAILAAFTILTGFSFYKNSELEKETKEELAKIKGFEDKISDLEKKSKAEIENQKNEIEKNLKERTESQNTEFSNLKEEIKKDRENLFREISDSYFTTAMQSFEMAKKYYEKAQQDFGIDSLNTYFLRLSECFDIFTKNNIELNKLDIITLKYLQAEISELYQKDAEFIKNNVVILISFEIFSKSFFKFIKFCKNAKKLEHLEIARDIWAMYSKFKKIAGMQQETNNDPQDNQ